MNEINVLVPEKVIVSYRLARNGVRVIALLIDTFLSVLASFVISILATMALPQAVGSAIAMLTITFGYFVYFILLEGLWNGVTVGKYMMGLRVRMADGTPVTFAAAMYRNLLRFADFFPAMYLTGAATIYFSDMSQRLGDMAAGTIVVSEKFAKPADQTAPHNYGIHAFEANVGDLRTMTRSEYVLLKHIADRFPDMPEVSRQKALDTVWQPFAKNHRIAPVENVHPLYLMEAVVMKYGRLRGLL